MGLWFRATPLPLRSFPEKRCSQVLSGCYPALASEASKVLAQHLSQPFKTKGAIMYLNRVTLIGFTGQQPKTLATRTGKELTRLSVATTRRFQQDAEWKEKTQWHDCVLCGATAHFAATLPKGSHVLIEGGTHLPGVRAECRIRDGRYQSALASNRDCCRIDQTS